MRMSSPRMSETASSFLLSIMFGKKGSLMHRADEKYGLKWRRDLVRCSKEEDDSLSII